MLSLPNEYLYFLIQLYGRETIMALKMWKIPLAFNAVWGFVIYAKWMYEF